jgi:hypothetical protein
MRYKPKSAAALEIALGGLPNSMRVEADPDVGVSAKTVGELRHATTWPENLAITTPHEHSPESADGSAASKAFWLMASGRADPATSARLQRSLLSYCRRDTWAMVKLHQALKAISAC